MSNVLTDKICRICGIPLDAEYFDVSGQAIGELPANHPFSKFTTQFTDTLPRRGERIVLTSFQLHPQYCGVLTYFSQFTDLYAEDNRQILTPGFEWSIVQNGKPVFPYTSLDRIVNPWGYNCLPIAVRLDENAKVEFVLSNRSVSDGALATYPIKAFAGRIMGRYWYNEIFGGRNVR
jgi:hypothetical protein